MKYYKKYTKHTEVNIITKYDNYMNRYALRSELGEEDGKDIDWYNSIYAKTKMSLNPKLDWYEYISLGIAIIILSIITGLYANNFFFAIISYFVYYLSFLIYRVFKNHSYKKTEVKYFNELKIVEQTDEWIKKDNNGDRYIIFYSYEHDVDHTQLKLTDKEYRHLKKYRFEIENFLSFPNYDFLNELENRSIPTLYQDLKHDNAIII